VLESIQKQELGPKAVRYVLFKLELRRVICNTPRFYTGPRKNDRQNAIIKSGAEGGDLIVALIGQMKAEHFRSQEQARPFSHDRSWGQSYHSALFYGRLII
jgi:hypothetical protein